jgi:hypothetical protein
VPYIETAESIGLGSTEYSVEKFIPDEIVEHENPDDKEGNGLRTQEAFLYQNSPNPFNPETAVEFNIAGSSTQRIPVRLCVYDLNGINVKTLISDELKPGTHKISWHGDNNAGEKVASGIYTAFLEASGKRQGIKMILLK